MTLFGKDKSHFAFAPTCVPLRHRFAGNSWLPYGNYSFVCKQANMTLPHVYPGPPHLSVSTRQRHEHAKCPGHATGSDS